MGGWNSRLQVEKHRFCKLKERSIENVKTYAEKEKITEHKSHVKRV